MNDDKLREIYRLRPVLYMGSNFEYFKDGYKAGAESQQEENKKLREALEAIIEGYFDNPEQVIETAEQALKKEGE